MQSWGFIIIKFKYWRILPPSADRSCPPLPLLPRVPGMGGLFRYSFTLRQYSSSLSFFGSWKQKIITDTLQILNNFHCCHKSIHSFWISMCLIWLSCDKSMQSGSLVSGRMTIFNFLNKKYLKSVNDLINPPLYLLFYWLIDQSDRKKNTICRSFI